MRLSEAAVAEIRASAIAARDQCNPHGVDCWRVHWPCRALLLADSVTETLASLTGERAAHEKDVAEHKHLIGILQGRLERIVFVLDTHRALILKFRAKVNEAADQLEGLHA